MSQTIVKSGGGIGFCGLLTIVLLTLKLVGVITISWWWVFCPLWIGFAVALLALIVAAIFTLLTIGAVAFFNR